MAIHFATSIEGPLLLVEASGFDESLAEVQQYGMAIIEACVKGGVTRILCNEVALEYRLNTVDTYLAAEFIAANAPHVARVAIVSDPRQITDARFWETVAVNRGLTVRAFKELDAARAWLGSAEGP